jgi:hypothetical protein
LTGIPLGESDLFSGDSFTNCLLASPSAAYNSLAGRTETTGADEMIVAQGSIAQLPTLDFPATQAEAVLGTAAYMSPEQAQAQPTDVRSYFFIFRSTALPSRATTPGRAK